MARKTGHSCKTPGCPGIAEYGERYCKRCQELHGARGEEAREADKEYNKTRWKNGRLNYYATARWKEERKKFLAAHSVCEFCGRPAVVVDHINRYRNEAEFFDQLNWQALCWSCHSIKTNRERKRFKGRGAVNPYDKGEV